ATQAANAATAGISAKGSTIRAGGDSALTPLGIFLKIETIFASVRHEPPTRGNGVNGHSCFNLPAGARHRMTELEGISFGRLPGTVNRFRGATISNQIWFDERIYVVMIKLVYCITKKAGLTDQEFFDYWKNIHGPIGARIPRLRRLVQSHRLIVPGDKYQPDYYGMA